MDKKYQVYEYNEKAESSFFVAEYSNYNQAENHAYTIRHDNGEVWCDGECILFVRD